MLRKFFLRYRILLITITFLTLFLFLISNVDHDYSYANQKVLAEIDNLDANKLPDTDEMISLWQKNDSLQKIRQWKINRIKAEGDGISLLFLALRKVRECDSCNTSNDNEFLKDKYFIEIPEYRLHQDATFFIDRNRYMIKYIVWDSTLGSRATLSKKGHFEEKKVSVRFSMDPMNEDKGSSLLVPVSAKSYSTLKVFFWIVFFVILILSVYIILILPFKILYRIATGSSFTKSNVKDLHTIGWALMIFGIMPVIAGAISKLVLGNKVPSELYFSFVGSIYEHRLVLLSGFIVFLLAKAFKRGYKLQEQEDLTI